MTMLVGLLAAAISAGLQAGAPVDTTVAVTAATKLRIESSAGRITVKTWDQNAVHVVATPRPGTTISIEGTAALLDVRSSGHGRIDEAEFVMTVPRKMSMTLGSGDLAIDVTGSEGDITAKNYSGAITVNGGQGVVSLKSVMGEVSLRNARGRISVQSMNAAVKLTDVSGDVDASSSTYHVYLTHVDSHALTASSVGGVIWFSGPLYDDGHYSFTTHAGSVFLTLKDPVNASFDVSTVTGAFASAFEGVRTQGARRGRFSVKVGSGAAIVDVESFSGGIVVRRE
jgi:DUF4097 and DUF4098 domain-containing protein YvlB